MRVRLLRALVLGVLIAIAACSDDSEDSDGNTGGTSGCPVGSPDSGPAPTCGYVCVQDHCNPELTACTTECAILLACSLPCEHHCDPYACVAECKQGRSEDALTQFALIEQCAETQCGC